MSHKKEVFSIYILTAVSLMGLVPLMFAEDHTNFFGYIFDNNLKVDVYYHIDKLRYPENVATDIMEMITMSIMIWTIKNITDSELVRKYISCFLIVSIINFMLYFYNYNQFSSFVTMPLLVIMLFLVKIRNK